MPDVFDAIGHPVRRQVLDLLRTGPRPVHQIAPAFAMSRPAVSQHLKVLLDAGLVVERKVGRERHYQLDGRPLREVEDWVGTYETFWRERMEALGRVLDETTCRDDRKGLMG